MVQWLRLSLPLQGVQVRSLVGELRSHMPCENENINQNQYCNKFNKDLKRFHWNVCSSRVKWECLKKKKKKNQLECLGCCMEQRFLIMTQSCWHAFAKKGWIWARTSCLCLFFLPFLCFLEFFFKLWSAYSDVIQVLNKMVLIWWCL